jgi:hypothetical protein
MNEKGETILCVVMAAVAIGIGLTGVTLIWQGL